MAALRKVKDFDTIGFEIEGNQKGRAARRVTQEIRSTRIKLDPPMKR